MDTYNSKIFDTLFRQLHQHVYVDAPESKISVVPKDNLVSTGLLTLKTLSWVKNIQKNDPVTFIVLGEALAFKNFKHIALAKGLNGVKENKEIADILLDQDVVKVDNGSFANEAFLDNIVKTLKFLYRDEFSVVPLLVSDTDLSAVYKLIAVFIQILNKHNVYLIVPTDLSSNVNYQIANIVDMRLINLMLDIDDIALLDEAFNLQEAFLDKGSLQSMLSLNATYIAMNVAKGLGLEPFYVGYYNKGDITGDTNSVVGYGGILYGKYDWVRLLASLSHFTMDYYLRKGGEIVDVPESMLKNESYKDMYSFVEINVNKQSLVTAGNIKQQPMPAYASVVKNTINGVLSSNLNISFAVDAVLKVWLFDKYSKIKFLEQLNINDDQGFALEVNDNYAVFMPDAVKSANLNIQQVLEELSTRVKGAGSKDSMLNGVIRGRGKDKKNTAGRALARREPAPHTNIYVFNPKVAVA